MKSIFYQEFMKKFLLLIAMFFLSSINVYSKSGCCSWHGGMSSSCDGLGRVICKDGTISPSCLCDYDPIFTDTAIYGCTDKKASNYNSFATANDGSCSYYNYGCTDENAINYNSNANVDDGSCKQKISGCLDKNATNYDSYANVDDGTCKYFNTTNFFIGLSSVSFILYKIVQKKINN